MQGNPFKWVAIIHLVFFVINFSIKSGSIFKDSSISTKTGFAPTFIIALATETHVLATVITSSFFFIFKIFNEISIASVPLAHVAIYFDFTTFFNLFYSRVLYKN